MSSPRSRQRLPGAWCVSVRGAACAWSWRGTWGGGQVAPGCSPAPWAGGCCKAESTAHIPHPVPCIPRPAPRTLLQNLRLCPHLPLRLAGRPCVRFSSPSLNSPCAVLFAPLPLLNLPPEPGAVLQPPAPTSGRISPGMWRGLWAAEPPLGRDFWLFPGESAHGGCQPCLRARCPARPVGTLPTSLLPGEERSKNDRGEWPGNSAGGSRAGPQLCSSHQRVSTFLIPVLFAPS